MCECAYVCVCKTQYCALNIGEIDSFIIVHSCINRCWFSLLITNLSVCHTATRLFLYPSLDFGNCAAAEKNVNIVVEKRLGF